MTTAEDVVWDAVEELLALRRSVDHQLTECLARLRGKGRRRDADADLPPKKRRTASADQDLPSERPCRLDLSSWATLLAKECEKAQLEVEGRTGKRARPSYIYGNYPNYYSYRLRKGTDPRLQVLSPEGKDCLDVGCHIGLLPLSLATEFCPASVTGVEIDEGLCQRARELRLQLMRTYREGERTEVVARLKSTRFVCGDFLESVRLSEKFDVITCLSVSKWIHLHHGDAGMRSLFAKFWELLRENGVLIFEPQPFPSYARAFRKQDMTGVPFRASDLAFLPDQFLPYLTETVGFEAVEERGGDVTGGGFERPIHVLRKRTAALC